MVPKAKKQEGEAVPLQCAHGDITLYPLTEVKMEMEGLQVKREEVSDKLPVPVLLKIQVPELGKILKSNPRRVHTKDVEEVIVVTRTQKEKKKR